jgi:hypothetical protein
MNRFRSALVGVCLLGLGGCAANVPPPTAEMAGGDPARLAELREGRDLYISKCSACHVLYDADRFPADRWTREVHEMLRLKKVKLTEAQTDRLLLYLLTAVGGRP